MRDLTYGSMRVEGVGGGCTVLRRDLPDGTVLVVSDGSAGHGIFDDSALPIATLYASQDAWASQDSCPPLAEWNATTAAELLDQVNAYVRDHVEDHLAHEAVVKLDEDTALRLRRLKTIPLICVDMLALDSDGTVIDDTPSLLIFDTHAAANLARNLLALVEL